jgi:hypothetical protein
MKKARPYVGLFFAIYWHNSLILEENLAVSRVFWPDDAVTAE